MLFLVASTPARGGKPVGKPGASACFCLVLPGNLLCGNPIRQGHYITLVITGRLKKEPLLTLPKETVLGALMNYITDPEHKKFQPVNSNWGILAPMEMDKRTKKDKKLKNELLANRSIKTLRIFI